MDFRILGPVEVREDGRPVPLGGRKQRAVLALLLLNANRVVSRDALIDRLWDGSPPPTAATALQGHVSSLRKALGADVIATRSPGYVLEVDPGQFDLARFEALCGKARGALEDGDASAAATGLRAALDLWRGQALADIRYEPAVDGEAARLDDLRLTAVEDRIDADLATGDPGRDLVGELYRLVAAHPLRERLWGQLMIALYRSGRQADALEVYRRARGRLIAELGIEPGQPLRELESRILAQDPALDPKPRRVTEARTPRRVGLGRLAIAALLLAAVATGVLLSTGGSDAPPAIPANGLAIVDPGEGRITDAISLDGSPGPIAAGAGAVWAVDVANSTVTRIDPRSRRVVRSAGIVGSPGTVAAARGEVWIADGCTNGGVPGALAHIFTTRGGETKLDSDVTALDQAFRAVTPRLTPVPPPPKCGLAARGLSAWVGTNVPPGLVRVDYDGTAGKSRIVMAVRLPRPPAAIALGAGSLWVADNGGDVVRRVDSANGRVLRVIRTGSEPVAIAAGAGAVWVANRHDGSVSRIDPRTDSVTKSISVGEQPVALATGEGSVWVANSEARSLSRVDPRTNEVVLTISLGRRPEGVAVAGGAVWVTVRP